ncbi:hypothetical protein NL676_013105 [Syzygium grande]|nr:hypothetical protein NL676_013105 [Syzygium grande]
MVAPPRFIAVVVLLPLLTFVASVRSANPLYGSCGSNNFTANGTYAASLSSLLASVTTAAANASNTNAARR